MNKFFYLIFIIFSSCISLSEKQSNEFEILKVEYRKKVKLSELIQTDFKYTPLATSGTPLIGNVHKIIPSKSGYFILDKYLLKKVLHFDNSGKFIQQIGQSGQAEGEYQHPIELLLVNNTLEIFDRGKYAILKYSISGDFLEEWTIPFNLDEMQILNGNTKVLYVPNDGPDFHVEDVLNVVTENYKESLASFFPYEDGIDDAAFPGFIHVFGKHATFARSLTGEIYQITPELEIKPRFKIDFGKHSWPFSKKEMKERMEELESIFFKGGVMSITHRLIETDEYFLFQTFMSDGDPNRRVVDQEEEKWLCILHKPSKRLIAIHEVENDLPNGIFAFPISSIGNRLLSVVSGEKIPLTTLKNIIGELDFESNNKSLNINAINPVIMEFTFNKSFFENQ